MCWDASIYLEHTYAHARTRPQFMCTPLRGGNGCKQRLLTPHDHNIFAVSINNKRVDTFITKKV